MWVSFITTFESTYRTRKNGDIDTVAGIILDNLAEGSLLGDLNLDGAVNAKDVRLLQDWILGKKVTIPGNADIDGDGTVDVFDLGQLKQIVKK
jgi:hypothetical protein